MKNKTPQLFIIHGGMTFKSQKDYLHYLKNKKVSLKKRKNWAVQYLDEKLGKKVRIIRPRMPLQDNAKYSDWKIMFERYIPLLEDNIILMGNSLGGIFLAKYLSEHRFPKKILSIYLVCPPFDNTLGGEDLAGGFKLKSNISLLEKQTKNLYLLFSKDDDVVPITHAKKYADKLKNAKITIFKSKNGHFDVPVFPEIVKMIYEDLKNR